MARISGMILGLGLLVVISQMTSPVSAGDHDDDDGYFKHRRRYCTPIVRRPIVRQPVFYRNPYAAQPYYSGGYGIPQPQSAPIAQQPIVPPPLPPSALQQNDSAYPPAPAVNSPTVTPPGQRFSALPQQQPGQFVEQAVPLYPYVRVKDAGKVPGLAVPKILAVASPDPFRFPGLVYVQVSVPPCPCRGVKIKDRGAKTVLNYGDFEVEVTSSQGLVTIDYDD